MGDQVLPEDLMKSGPFGDTIPPTGSVMKEQLAEITVTLGIRQKFDGKGEDESDSDGEGDDEGDAEELTAE